MTLEESLAKGAAQLFQGPHGERARPDAETLLLHVLGKNKTWRMAHAEEEISVGQADRYDKLLERRRRGEPIQYITGETEFYGLPLHVTRDVLIPRPETELVVEKVLEFVGAPSFPRSLRKVWETECAFPPRIVDVGTGSGAIAIALAHRLTATEVTAIDCSAAALAIACENAVCNDKVRIRFLEGDLLAPVADEQFDIVVSNPPYVPESDRASLAVEVRDYEPAQALFAGSDGLGVYRRLIPQAFAALAPGGFAVFEIGYGQEACIRALLADAGFVQIAFAADLQGIARVASARRA
jgi:release factor glutamine methyltransferase